MAAISRITQQIVEVLGTGDSKARVTQQLVEVLGTGDSKARVTQQFVEVLGDAYFHISVISTLAFVQAAANNNIEVDNTLNLSGVATFIRDVFANGSNALNLSQTTDVHGPIYIEINHSLSFQQETIAHASVVNLSVEHVLDLEQAVSQIIPITATSTLSLSGVGSRRNIASSTLALAQAVVVAKGTGVESSLTLSQTVNLAGVFYRSVEHALGLTHSGTYQYEPSGLLCSYVPFVGFGTAITPPDTEPPALGTATLTLTYPFVTPTTTLVLRNPEFSNKDSLNFNRINRQTRGGTLVVFADIAWPKIQTLQVEMRALKHSQANDLLAFFSDSLGKEIGLLDHENRQWRGIITEPSSPVSNPGRNDMSVSFTFEGELV